MRLIAALLMICTCLTAQAVELNLVAIMGDKVMVEVDGSKPKLLAPGQNTNEVKLISISNGTAVFDVGGKKQTLTMDNRSFKGSSERIKKDAETSGKTLTLPAQGGHFFAQLTVNGMPLRGLIDTGATTLAMSSVHAKMANIDYSKAPTGYAQTAQGVVPFRQVKVNVLKFGDIVLYNIDATVLEGRFPAEPLIGMNILERFTMQREADRLLLIQRY